MALVLGRSFDDAPKDLLVLRPLVEKAVDAANRAKPFNETANVGTLRLFVRLCYEGDTPVSVEIGQDHSGLLSDEVAAELKANPKIILNTQEPWTAIDLIKSGS